MTNRQKRVIGEIQPQLSDVYIAAQAELSSSPMGHMTQVRLCPGFNRRPVSVAVMKDSDGFLFRVEEWPRKGWTPSKMRRLFPSAKS